MFSSVQLPSHVWLFAAAWTAAHQASLSSTSSRSLLRLVSVESVTPSNRLILCLPFSSCLQLLPASGSFQMSQFFASDGQSIGVSASTSVLPVTVQHWFPLGNPLKVCAVCRRADWTASVDEYFIDAHTDRSSLNDTESQSAADYWVPPLNLSFPSLAFAAWIIQWSLCWK